MSIIKRTTNPEQEKALKIAEAAISNGDGGTFWEGLFGSMLLEGYKTKFSEKYPRLDEDDIDDEIGAAVDDLYTRLFFKKEKIRSFPGYLWRIIDGRLSDLVAIRKHMVSLDDAEKIGASYQSIDVEPAKEELDRRRLHVLNIAEGLLPRIGLTNAQKAVGYLLGSIKNGVRDLNSTEIAKALGMTPGNVRQSMRRGLERLGRIIREENLVDPSYVLPFEESEFFNDDEDIEDDDNF